MNDRSNKPPKRNGSKHRKRNKQEQLGEIEYYLNRDGNDTQIVKDIAISSLIPKVDDGKKKILTSEFNLSGIPFFVEIDEGTEEKAVANPFWSFTMVMKKGGNHKLLFSSQEQAEDLFHVLLKEDLGSS